MSRYIKSHKPLRGGWDTGPDEYKALGFTIGLPPNLYVPQTQPIVDLSQRYETCDSNFINLDSKFYVKERQFMLQTGSNARCYVRDLPANLNAEMLREALNAKIYQRKLTTSPHAIVQVVINPNNEFAFVDFEKVKDAEKFIELKDSFELEGHTLRIRRSHADLTNDSVAGEVPQEKNDSLLICNIDKSTDENFLETLISEHAAVEKVQIPTLNGKRLGYAIVDLQDTNLANVVMMKLKLINGLDVRRCFPYYEQSPRKPLTFSKVNEMKFYSRSENSKTNNKYSIFVEDEKDYAICDILNLDIDVSKISSGLPSNDKCRKIRIFNILKSLDDNEMNEVVNDMKAECSAFANVIACFPDMNWDRLVQQVGVPVVVVFANPEDANKAQRGISGRKYKGRIVITMLEGDDQRNP